MYNFVVVLSADDMQVIDNALGAYVDEHTAAEWQEHDPEQKAKIDALVHKLSLTAKFVAETQVESPYKGDKPEEA